MRPLHPLMSLLVSSAAQGQTCASLGVDAASTLTLAAALQRTRHRRLGDLDEHQMKDKPTRLRAVLQATVEVGRPTLFPTIIIAAHLPVFTLQRHEGRIFSPMARSVTSALVGSLVLALSLVPLLCLLLLNKNLPHRDNRLVRACKRLCTPALAWVIERPRTVLTGALLCLVAADFLATTPGSEFLPGLNEGSIGVNASLPPSGEFETQQSAMKRLSGVVPLSIFVIFLLLFDAFKSFHSALLILANIPFALIGAIVALSRTGIPLSVSVSVSAAIGFMALFGQTVLNGVVTVTHNNELGSEGVELVEPAHRRSLTRLRIVLMTALLGMLGLLPMALSHAIGAETQRPQAVVVMGGLISATVMTRLLLPTLCIWFARREGVMHEHV